MRGRLTFWLILFIGGFLLGYVPEYLKNRELQAQLENPKKTIDELNLQLKMSELRDQASLMLIELSRQNYGLARDYSGQFYSRLNELIAAVPDPSMKKSLQELAATRDSVTEALATPTPTSLTVTQPVVLKTFEVTKVK